MTPLSTSLRRSQELAEHKTAAWLPAPSVAQQHLGRVVPGLCPSHTGLRLLRPRVQDAPQGLTLSQVRTCQ